jgi:transcription elongation factor GreB
MSKAFTKDDRPDEPLVVPPRAPLPPGVPNYVTARGLVLLREELAALETDRARLGGDDPERARRRAVVAGRMRELAERIGTAVVVDPRAQSHDEVRFGATVTLRVLEGRRPGDERRVQIVGVDEAAPAEGRVAFVAPIARAILGLRVGETAVLRVADGDELLEVVAIDYGTT